MLNISLTVCLRELFCFHSPSSDLSKYYENVFPPKTIKIELSDGKFTKIAGDVSTGWNFMGEVKVFQKKFRFCLKIDF